MHLLQLTTWKTCFYSVRNETTLFPRLVSIRKTKPNGPASQVLVTWRSAHQSKLGSSASQEMLLRLRRLEACIGAALSDGHRHISVLWLFGLWLGNGSFPQNTTILVSGAINYISHLETPSGVSVKQFEQHGGLWSVSVPPNVRWESGPGWYNGWKLGTFKKRTLADETVPG